MKMNRRQFLKTGALAAAAAGLAPRARAEIAGASLKPNADAMIMIWLPGGMAQTDLWDPEETHALRQGHERQRIARHLQTHPHLGGRNFPRRRFGEHRVRHASRLDFAQLDLRHTVRGHSSQGAGTI